jgi:U3 small nucleolar RNA-associated protein 20
MGEDKFEQQLKQVIANISYEYQDGRMSGVALLNLVIDRLPQELLDKYAQMLFLPLVMQLLNDESKDCRLKVADCIKLLFTRVSSEMMQSFQDYLTRWCKQSGPLCLASLQVFSLLVESRPEFLRSGSLMQAWTLTLQRNLQIRQMSEWEITYFSLLCLEKLLGGNFNSILYEHKEMWSSVTDCLVDEHPWVKLSASRILRDFVASDSATAVCTQNDGLAFNIVRNLCLHFNAPEGDQSEELTDLVTKSLSHLLPLMQQRPELFYKEDKEDGESEKDQRRAPIFWLIRRLSQMAKNKGCKRRLAIFKCYGLFAAKHFPIVAPHLELMLDGLHRTIVEGQNELENQKFSQKMTRKSISTATALQDHSTQASPDEYTMAEEVLRLLEDSCVFPEEFLAAYAAVKGRAREKKDKRKTEVKAQAVLDPQAYAGLKIQKQARNKERRKRRTQEQRQDMGGLAKRQRSS